MNQDLFLSYACLDLPIARRVARELERRGFRCWFAARDLQAEANPLSAIAAALTQSRAGIVLCSPAATTSNQVLRELEWLVIHDRLVFVLDVVPTPSAGLLGELLKQTTRLDFAIQPFRQPGRKAVWRKLKLALTQAGVQPGAPRHLGTPSGKPFPTPGWLRANRRNAELLKAAVLVGAIAALGTFGLGRGLNLPGGLSESGSAGPAQVHFYPVLNDESHVRVEPLPDQLARQIRNSIGMKFNLIPAGSFTRRPSAEPTKVSVVTLSQPFYIGITEVTQQQFRRVMGFSGSRFTGDLLPVDAASWDEAVEFCVRLSALPDERMAGRSYRLPTESEWEFAARAGSGNRFFFGNQAAELLSFAWLDQNSADCTHAVGTKFPNPWGLYDLYGNASEWCHDWLGDYSTEAQTNPSGPEFGTERIHRGGNFGRSLGQIHAGFRSHQVPTLRLHGFRIVCSTASPLTEIQPELAPRLDRIEGDPMADLPLLQSTPGSRMENRFDR